MEDVSGAHRDGAESKHKIMQLRAARDKQEARRREIADKAKAAKMKRGRQKLLQNKLQAEQMRRLRSGHAAAPESEELPPVVNLRSELGTLPRVGLIPRLALASEASTRANALQYKEKMRNDLIERYVAVSASRQAAGRARHAERVAAATKIQSMVRSRHEAVRVGNLVEEMQRRIREEEETAARLARNQQRTIEATALKERARTMSGGPLKALLHRVESFDSVFELEVRDSWAGQRLGLLKALEVFTSARTLRFRSVGLRSKRGEQSAVEALAAALVHQTELLDFGVPQCGLVAGDLEPLLRAVKAGCQKLRRLDLSGNWIARGRWERMDDAGRPVYEELAQVAVLLSSSIKTLPLLEAFSLSRNGLGDTVFQAFVSGHGFSVPKSSLVDVDLSFNKLTHRSAFSLSHMICSCVGLRKLCLAGNHLSASSIGVLESSLALHRGLQELSLDGNRIEDGGVLVLARILKANRGIRSLGLANVGFSHAGLASIATAVGGLGRLYRLADLDLSGNRLRAATPEEALACVHAIAEMLAATRSLRVFGLRDLALCAPSKPLPARRKHEGRQVLAPLSVLLDGLAMNNTLRTLDLRGNNIDAPTLPPRMASAIILDARRLRPGLYISRARQEAVAQVFARYASLAVDHVALAAAVLRVLAFDCEQRQVLL